MKIQMIPNKLKKFFLKILFPMMGLVSLIWFLIRVIPKPSRATYPCMRVAYPMASSFVTYLLSLSIALFSFKKVREYAFKNRYKVAAFFFIVAMISGFWFLGHSSISLAEPTKVQVEHIPNEPMGTEVGIFPGRVVWAWNPDATNENQTGAGDGNPVVSENDDYWFLIKNNDQSVIDNMMKDVVKNITGELTIAESWNRLFRYHNMKKYESDSTYKAGEKIFIKINATSITMGDGGAAWHTWEPTALNKTIASWQNNEFNVPDIVETSPQVVLSVLRQLINEAGVQQADIYIGDPMKNVYKHLFDYWKNEFPDINVIGNDIYYNGLDLVALDRVPVDSTENPVIFYSDKGAEMDKANSDRLYTILEEADYMINIASLKAHACAGITLCAKNHFGSQPRVSAQHLHKGIIGVDNDNPYRMDYGMYRVQVDLMMHKYIGENTMLFLVDGLYSAVEGWTGAGPRRWDMSPFNGDFTNSIFGSLDPVALESVCFDFLRTEYSDTTDVTYNRPNMAQGVDDYLHQAADSANWPSGIIYDPENDGIIISSLGTHEHWNNATDKQYARNLGQNKGIELYTVFGTSDLGKNSESAMARSFVINQNYPNPFNAGTVISYGLSKQAEVSIEIFDITGQKVKTLISEIQPAGLHQVHWDGSDSNFQTAASGLYIYKINVADNSGFQTVSKRMVLLK